MSRIHTQATKDRATNLYFAIEKHFAKSDDPLRVQDISRMLGNKSNSTSEVYINLLIKWGLIHRLPHGQNTIVLAKTNYPPVAYI